MAGSAGSPATAEGTPPAAEVAVTDSVPAAAAPGATAGAAEDAAAAAPGAASSAAALCAASLSRSSWPSVAKSFSKASRLLPS